MVIHVLNKRRNSSFRGIVLFVLNAFLVTTIFSSIPPNAYALTELSLPSPTALISTSIPLEAPCIRGIKFYPNQPFRFDFIVDEGKKRMSSPELSLETTRLIKYFLASLTIPEDDLWVNLSPYERDIIIPEALGRTVLGEDLLGEDYILKQLLASITYPENPLGKRFWEKVYEKAYELYGTTDIPINTFNKIWIVPDKIVIHEEGDRAIVGESTLRVMMEEDYLALRKNLGKPDIRAHRLEEDQVKEISNFSSSIMKEVVLPIIEEEINNGENFAYLRQIYNSLILAVWFKMKLEQSLLGQIYIDKKKIKGVDTKEKQVKEKLYTRYIAAYERGAYDYIRTDYDSTSKKHIKRHYFSGGVDFADVRSGIEENIQFGFSDELIKYLEASDLRNAGVELSSATPGEKPSRLLGLVKEWVDRMAQVVRPSKPLVEEVREVSEAAPPARRPAPTPQEILAQALRQVKPVSITDRGVAVYDAQALIATGSDVLGALSERVTDIARSVLPGSLQLQEAYSNKLQQGVISVAVLNGEIVGFLEIGEQGIEFVAVEEGSRGNGAGSALLDQAFSEFRSQSIPVVTLDALPSAIPIYDTYFSNRRDQLSVVKKDNKFTISVRPPSQALAPAEIEVGRKVDLDEEGRIARVYDYDAQGNQVVWEEYKYKKTGEIESVSLFNPATGRKVMLSYETTDGDRIMWKIFAEDELGWLDEAGTFWTIFSQPDRIVWHSIKVSEKGEFRGQGLAKAAVRWLALKAAREGKKLEVFGTITPVSAYMSRHLFDCNKLTITTKPPAYKAAPLEGVSEATIDDILLSRRVYFIYRDKSGEGKQIVLTPNLATGEILGRENLPIGYSASLDIERKQLRVTDAEGRNVFLEYADDPLYWTGEVNTSEIVKDQKSEYGILVGAEEVVAVPVITEADRIKQAIAQTTPLVATGMDSGIYSGESVVAADREVLNAVSNKLVEIAGQAFEEDTRHLYPHLRTSLETNSAILAVEKGKIVGFLTFSVKFGEVNIDLVAVSPEAQRRGIGTALMNQAIDTFVSLNESGANIEEIIVNSTPQALDFYTNYFSERKRKSGLQWSSRPAPRAGHTIFSVTTPQAEPAVLSDVVVRAQEDIDPKNERLIQELVVSGKQDLARMLVRAASDPGQGSEVVVLFMDIAKMGLRNTVHSPRRVDDMKYKVLALANKSIKRNGGIMVGVAGEVGSDEIGVAFRFKKDSDYQEQLRQWWLELQADLILEEVDEIPPQLPAGFSVISNPADFINELTSEDVGWFVDTTIHRAEENQEQAKVSREDRERPIKNMFSGREYEKPVRETEKIPPWIAAVNVEVKEAQARLNQPLGFVRESIYSALQMRTDTIEDIVEVARKQTEPVIYWIRGPPDTFYAVIADGAGGVQEIKFVASYKPTDTLVADAFHIIEHRSGRPKYREHEEGRFFGFKPYNDYFGHNAGNFAIALINVKLSEIFEGLLKVAAIDGRNTLTREEVLEGIKRAGAEINSTLSKQYGAEVYFEASAANSKSKDVEDYAREQDISLNDALVRVIEELALSRENVIRWDGVRNKSWAQRQEGREKEDKRSGHEVKWFETNYQEKQMVPIASESGARRQRDAADAKVNLDQDNEAGLRGFVRQVATAKPSPELARAVSRVQEEFSQAVEGLAFEIDKVTEGIEQISKRPGVVRKEERPEVSHQEELAERRLTGNIIGPEVTPQEEKEWREAIERSSDNIKRINKTEVDNAKATIEGYLKGNEGRNRRRLEDQLYKFLANKGIDIARILDALDLVSNTFDDIEGSFKWFEARVDAKEKYLLGHESALAVDIIEYLHDRAKVTGDRTLLVEYILHEALEKIKELNHRDIIDFTTSLFDTDPLRPRGNPLRDALRAYIDYRVTELPGYKLVKIEPSQQVGVVRDMIQKGQPVKVYFACTFNLERSAMGHVLTEHLAKKLGRSNVEIASGGVSTIPGAPFQEDLRNLLDYVGEDVDPIALESFSSEHITEETLRDSDIIFVSHTRVKEEIEKYFPQYASKIVYISQISPAHFSPLLSPGSDVDIEDYHGYIGSGKRGEETLRGDTFFHSFYNGLSVGLFGAQERAPVVAEVAKVVAGLPAARRPGVVVSRVENPIGFSAQEISKRRYIEKDVYHLPQEVLMDMLDDENLARIAPEVGVIKGAADGTSDILAGNYRLEQILGKGAFGEAWLATRLSDMKKVVIKRLKEEIVNGDLTDLNYNIASLLKERMVQELMQKDIPQVAKVLGAGHYYVNRDEERRNAFIVMEYVEGESLEDVFNARGLTEEEIYNVLEQLLEASAKLHERGVIHCDIKPANIYVTKDGQVKILDFGMAHQDSDGDGVILYTQGPYFGSPSFMPEQSYEWGIYSAKTDLFAIGVILYELTRGLPSDWIDTSGDEDFHNVRKYVEELEEELMQGRHKTFFDDIMLGLLSEDEYGLNWLGRLKVLTKNDFSIKDAREALELLRKYIKPHLAVTTKAKQLAGRIHGLYVRSADGKVIYINRDRLAQNLDDFKEVLGEDVTLEQALHFIDGHESFHALIDKLIGQGVDLAEIDEVEEERLADIVGKAFALGVGEIDADLEDEFRILRDASGIDLAKVLNEAPLSLEELLSQLGIDVEVEFKTPEEMAEIKREAQERQAKVKAEVEPVEFNAVAIANEVTDNGKEVIRDLFKGGEDGLVLEQAEGWEEPAVAKISSAYEIALVLLRPDIKPLYYGYFLGSEEIANVEEIAARSGLSSMRASNKYPLLYNEEYVRKVIEDDLPFYLRFFEEADQQRIVSSGLTSSDIIYLLKVIFGERKEYQGIVTGLGDLGGRLLGYPVREQKEGIGFTALRDFDPNDPRDIYDVVYSFGIDSTEQTLPLAREVLKTLEVIDEIRQPKTPSNWRIEFSKDRETLYSVTLKDNRIIEEDSRPIFEIIKPYEIPPEEKLPEEPQRAIRERPEGGIDLAPVRETIEIEGEGIEMPLDKIPFDLKTFEGFTFTIIKLERVEDVGRLLGHVDKEEKEVSSLPAP